MDGPPLWGWPKGLARGREHAHPLPAGAVVLELDDPFRQREEGVVLGQAHVLPRLPGGAVLTDDDRAALHLLTAESLHAQALRIAVAPVAARALPLLVRHVLPAFPLGLGAVDPNRGEGLTVVLCSSVVLTPLLLEDPDLGVPVLLHDGSHHGR